MIVHEQQGRYNRLLSGYLPHGSLLVTVHGYTHDKDYRKIVQHDMLPTEVTVFV